MICTILLYPIHYILIPDYYGKVINSFKDKAQAMFVFHVKMLLFVYLASWVIESVVLYLQYKILPNFTEYATGSIFEFILDHYELDFENIHTGEILSKIIRMPKILFEYVDVFRVEFLKELFVLFTAVFKFYSVSMTAVLTYLFFIVVNYIFIYIMFNKFFEYDLKSNQSQDKMYEALVDCFNNLSSVYVFNQKKEESERFYNDSFKEYKEMMSRSWLVYIAGDIFWGGVTISLFVVMNFIVYKAFLDKEINAETLISTFIIIFSIIRLYEKSEGSAHRLADVYSNIKDTEMFFNKISDYNYNTNKTNSASFKNGDIEFRHIYHKYGDDFVLENVNLRIQKGEKVVIVGQIGSGKSTLIKLLIGFQPLNMGSIRIGGTSVNEISNEEIRSNIFYIPQKPKLFNRTLYENIVYGLPTKPSPEDILRLLDDLGLNEIRETFDLKMDENVGVDGNSLSGGQRQIVWLLRSFYRQSKILVMDEPTSSLDPANKELMITIIKKMSPGKTVILISHDHIDASFRKIEMKQGRLVDASYFQ